MTDSRPLKLAAWAVAAVLIALAGARLLDRGPDSQPVAAPRVEGGPGGGGGGGGSRVYVHVAGRVRRPGLYRLPTGARLAAAVERAGGPARGADLAGINLAARVQDGEQVVVPRAGAARAAAPPGGGPSAGSGAGAKLSLANATVGQLDRLDGIGPTLARRIIAYRDEHGGFRSVGQLREVEGIGEKRFATLKEAVRP